MPSPMSANQVLDRDFLPLRAKLIEIGAMLDRMDRSAGDVSNDPRRQTIQRALAVLQLGNTGRAEQLQLLFSLPYDEQWRTTFGLTATDPSS